MASKKAVTKKKKERLAKKRAAKQSQQALYESYKRAGRNLKSKRFVKGQRRLVKDHDHPHGECGNPGCTKCQGMSFRPYLKQGEPYNMPHKVYVKWMALPERMKEVERKRKHLDMFRGRV